MGALHAPALLDVEVAQMLRRLVQAGSLSEPRARASLEILQEFPIDRHLMTSLLPRIWGLRDNLTAYDACYLALAEGLGCSLLTLDRALAATAPEVAVEVPLL